MIEKANTLELPGKRRLLSEIEYAALWQDFVARISTEDQCTDQIWTAGHREGLYACQHCDSKELERKNGDRIAICKSCKKATWFTVGTFFEKASKMMSRLFAIELMENGIRITSSMLHKITGASQSSSLNFLNKLDTIILANMDSNGARLPSALFLDASFKRSRETPAKEHPSAEEHAAKAEYMKNNMETVDARDLSSSPPSCENQTNYHQQPEQQQQLEPELIETERLVFDLLSNVPLSVESIFVRTEMPAPDLYAILTVLEIKGLITNLPGDKYILRKPSTSDSEDLKETLPLEKLLVIVDIISYFMRHFRGISRKYLQKYLAAYWALVENKRWKNGGLLKACLQFTPISYLEMLSYVTPLFVMVLP